MATYLPGQDAVPTTWSADDDTVTNGHLIAIDGGYIIALDGTLIDIGGGYRVDNADTSATWVVGDLP